MTPRRRPSSDRRRFLGMAGAGLAVVGAGSLASEPLGDTPPPWEVDLKEEFGAAGDGEADDAPAIQAAFSALASEPGVTGAPSGITGARILVPPGDYILRSTVRIHRFAGIVQGSGVGMGPTPVGGLKTGFGTVFHWAGPAGEPMFEVTDSRFIQLRDLRFFGNDAAPPGAGVRFLKDSAEQSQGSNGEMVVEDCYFGVWPWTSARDEGLITTGIDVVGTIGDNDQIWISRCEFAGRTGAGTFGYRAQDTQSVWGSMSDCVFQALDVGLQSPASMTLFNPQFNRCGTDIDVASTARIDIHGWQSEHSGRLAVLSPWATLCARGGACQIDGEQMAPGAALIEASPSSDRQSICLSDMYFSYPRSRTYREGIAGLADRPDIRVGAPAGNARTSGFYVDVANCVGLDPTQCTLTEPVTGESRATVQWHSRSGGIHQFRNELRGSGVPGSRSTLDTEVWDPPIAGSS